MTKSRLSVLILAFLMITILEGCMPYTIYFKCQDSTYRNKIIIKPFSHSLKIELLGDGYEYIREGTSKYKLWLRIVVKNNDKHNIITYNTGNINILLNKTEMKTTSVKDSVFKSGNRLEFELRYECDLHEIGNSAKYTGWDGPPIISIDLSTFLTCNNEPVPIDTIYATDPDIGGVIK